jgi:hypothetical protein
MTTTAVAVPEETAERLAAMQGELTTLREAAVDAVTDTRRLVMEPVQREGVPTKYDRVRLNVPQNGDGPIHLRVLEGAHEQLAEKVGIPWKYYDRMLVEAPWLLAQNVNTWHTQQPGKRLIRMLKPVTAADQAAFAGLDTQYAVRAVLSDRYRPIDHGALLNTVLPVALERHLTVTEYKLTDRHFYVRFVAAKEELRQMLGSLGVEHRYGEDILAEVLSFGAALRNSETGHGAFNLNPMFEVLRCVNRLIVSDALRVVHIGGRNTEEEDFYAADTKALDAAAIFLKVRDRFAGFFTTDTKQKAAQVLLQGMGQPLALPESVSPFDFIDNVGQTFELSEAEQRILKDEVLAELTSTGRELTPFAVSQGLTATARRVGVDDFERKEELEKLGWKVLGDPVTALLKAGKAAR